MGAPARPLVRLPGRRPGLLAWLLLALALLLGLGAAARAEVPVPALSGRVIDSTGALSPVQRSALEAKLEAFEREAGPQIVVLVLPSTDGEDIAAFAHRVADAWKIGRREVGDGLLIVVARNDRRMRIEVAKALEGAVPDLAARQIVERQMAPAFKQGDFAGGLNAAVDALKARVAGEHLPPPAARPGTGGPALPLPADFGSGVTAWMMAGAIVFVVAPLFGRMVRPLLGRAGGALVAGGSGAAFGAWWGLGLGLAALVGIVAFVMALFAGAGQALRQATRGRGGPVVFDGGGFGGGFGGGSSGGGFSSGGGGDFGGGGASGDW